MDARPDCSIACTEQRWNEAVLEQPLAAPVAGLWHYQAPAVVLGCSQRRLLAAVTDTTALPVLLRASGGGAVLVGPWMLGLSVALPVDHPLVSGGPVPAYRWLGEALARVLACHAVDAVALSPQDLRTAPSLVTLPWACFGGLSPWEVVAGGRKLVGLAQVRRRHGVLLVGGLLLDRPDWPLLCAALGRPSDEAQALADVTTSLQAETGDAVSRELLAVAIERELARVWAETKACKREKPPLRRQWGPAAAISRGEEAVQ